MQLEAFELGFVAPNDRYKLVVEEELVGNLRSKDHRAAPRLVVVVI